MEQVYVTGTDQMLYTEALAPVPAGGLGQVRPGAAVAPSRADASKL